MEEVNNQNNQPNDTPVAADAPPQTAPEPKSGDNSLQATKRRALEALVALMPELSTLEPEQKFRICIDAIRFTDNRKLVDTALDAGLAIKDPQERADALLEIVAEINYLEQ